MMQTATGAETSLDGLWVLLVTDEQGERVPMMARAGENTYLLGFKTAPKAKQFLSGAEIEGAVEPRLVVPSNRVHVLSAAREGGAVGVLVDYDPVTHKYAAATEL